MDKLVTFSAYATKFLCGCAMPIAKTMDMTSAHLHVSVFRLNENVSHINKIMDSNFYLSYFNEPNWKYVINPFDYDDKNTWKGWEQ